jgi:hypothetical protein
MGLLKNFLHADWLPADVLTFFSISPDISGFGQKWTLEFILTTLN